MNDKKNTISQNNEHSLCVPQFFWSLSAQIVDCYKEGKGDANAALFTS
jgi:hypothetical protein